MWSQFRRRVGPANAHLMLALLILYIIQLVLLRTAAASLVEGLYLQPSAVFQEGAIWQPFTYVWLHSPRDPTHLLWNGLFLFWFGPRLEQHWGSRRYLRGFLFFAGGGALMTLLWGWLGVQGLLGASSLPVAMGQHLGASGGVMGVATAWCLVHRRQTVQLLFVGPVLGIHILYFLVGLEALRALSLGSGISVTSHVGGMMAAAILCFGLWQPSGWRKLLRRRSLERQRKRIEHDLRVIQGGRSDFDPDDPKNWN